MTKHMGQEVRTSHTHPILVNWLPANAVERVGLTFASGKKGDSTYGYRWDRDFPPRERSTHLLVILAQCRSSASSAHASVSEHLQHTNICGFRFLHAVQ